MGEWVSGWVDVKIGGRVGEWVGGWEDRWESG